MRLYYNDDGEIIKAVPILYASELEVSSYVDIPGFKGKICDYKIDLTNKTLQLVDSPFDISTRINILRS